MREANDHPHRKHRDLHDWAATFTLPAALAAAIFAGLAWCTATDTERRQLRAYLGNVGITLDSCPNSGRRPTISVDIKNAGLTPAYDVRAWLAQQPYPFSGSPNSYTIPDPQMTQSPEIALLLPGVSDHFFWTDQTEFLNQNTIESLTRQQKRNLYVGRVEFEDTFGAHRVLDFCWTLFMQGGCNNKTGYPYTNFAM